MGGRVGEGAGTAQTVTGSRGRQMVFGVRGTVRHQIAWSKKEMKLIPYLVSDFGKRFTFKHFALFVVDAVHEIFEVHPDVVEFGESHLDIFQKV